MDNQIKKIIKNKEFVCEPYFFHYNFVISVKSNTDENELIKVGFAGLR